MNRIKLKYGATAALGWVGLSLLPITALAAQDNGHAGMQMQGGSAPVDARDPHAYSGSLNLGAGPYALPGGRQLRLADEHSLLSVRVDRLQQVRDKRNSWGAVDAQLRVGRDYDAFLLKLEGDYDRGSVQEAQSDWLWSHAVSSYWNTQLGLRYDFGKEGERSWLALGLQGLAPYWIEVDANAYVTERGQAELNLELEYDLSLTQQWILQPSVAVNLTGKDDPQRERAKGLSDASVGLTLRYEINRQFAPYVGVEWRRKFGRTADWARAEGHPVSSRELSMGVSFWF
ncbi:copper resistance protein B [Balneatrix alpica]|uniref:copper resistance protein B n=1 Tax=Balneatrix alpica TaxID=75684 RepID=UPI0027390AF2|nr:copper resistance protein B [Balneatrix alpica]